MKSVYKFFHKVTKIVIKLKNIYNQFRYFFNLNSMFFFFKAYEVFIQYYSLIYVELREFEGLPKDNLAWKTIGRGAR